MIKYKTIYGKSIIFKGYITLHKHAHINIKKGKVLIKKGFYVKPYAYIAVVNDGTLEIDEGCSLGRNSIVICHDLIKIGKKVSIGPNVQMFDHNHNFGYYGVERGFKTAPIIIEDNCWLGAGVIVLKGTHIGTGSVIGAGSVISGYIPPHSIVTQNRELKIIPMLKK